MTKEVNESSDHLKIKRKSFHVSNSIIMNVTLLGCDSAWSGKN